MSKQEPMLMESPLTKHVFVVTSYKDNGDGTVTAKQKHDVTAQFDALARHRGGTCKLELATDMESIRCSACGYKSPKGTDLKVTKFCGGCGCEVEQ